MKWNNLSGALETWRDRREASSKTETSYQRSVRNKVDIYSFLRLLEKESEREREKERREMSD